jgi:DNA-binding XRE family transcriptional regulator
MGAQTTQISAVEIRRRTLGLSRKDLAERAGVSRRTVSSIEAGGLPQMRIALKLAEALASNLEDLFPQERAS